MIDLSSDLEGTPLLNRLIAIYNNESPKLMASLQQAYDENDFDAVSIIAHTLKSSSAQLGALEFAETCHVIEMHEEHNRTPDEVRELIETARKDLEIVIEMLNEVRL